MLQLEQRYVDEIIAHALEEDPNECCGMLAGRDGRVTKLYRITNVAADPYIQYRMDSQELLDVTREIDDSGWDVLAIYHSHTHTEAYPSPTDVSPFKSATGTPVAAWSEPYYILVSLLNRESPAVRAFHIEDGRIDEEELSIVHG